MNLPLYQGSASAAKSIAPGSYKTANTGLWYTRFYDAFEADWSVGDEGKRGWIDRVIRLETSGDTAQLASLNDRQQRLCLALGGVTAELETDGPFVTGMGLSHPVENGFTFHPTLGMPYLPASGIKGLLRGWVEAWMEHDEQTKNNVIARWFGASKGNDKDMPEGAGHLIFFDALPVKPVNLGCEIMTPHMGKWYEKGGQISPNDYATTAPADWHSPVPVAFLVVKNGTSFRFMVAPRLIGDDAADTLAKSDVILAMKELKNALEWIGAGAKTATGYGRMIDRRAENEAESKASLAAAGITVGEEKWDKAKLSWNKGNRTLTVVNENAAVNDKNKSVLQSGEQAIKTFDSLSETARTRLRNTKPVLVTAMINIKGNLKTLISLEEIV